MIVVLWAFAAPAMATPTPQAACALFSPELLANASGSPTVAQIWWDARTMPLVGLLECAEQFPEQRARALAWMGPVLDAWLLPGGPAELGLEGHPWRPRWGACDIAGVPPLLYLLARRAANASIDAEVVSAFADYWLRNKNLLPSGAAARVNGGPRWALPPAPPAPQPYCTTFPGCMRVSWVDDSFLCNTLLAHAAATAPNATAAAARADEAARSLLAVYDSPQRDPSDGRQVEHGARPRRRQRPITTPSPPPGFRERPELATAATPSLKRDLSMSSRPFRPTFDPQDGLLHHGYDHWSETPSCCKWGDGNGWALMGLADAAAGYRAANLTSRPLSAKVDAALAAFGRAWLAQQDDASGMWKQLLNETLPNASAVGGSGAGGDDDGDGAPPSPPPGNFLSSSATGFGLYGLATAVKLGVLPRDDATLAARVHRRPRLG